MRETYCSCCGCSTRDENSNIHLTRENKIQNKPIFILKADLLARHCWQSEKGIKARNHLKFAEENGGNSEAEGIARVNRIIHLKVTGPAPQLVHTGGAALTSRKLIYPGRASSPFRTDLPPGPQAPSRGAKRGGQIPLGVLPVQFQPAPILN